MEKQVAIQAFWKFAQENLESINLAEIKEDFKSGKSRRQSIRLYMNLSNLLANINKLTYLNITTEVFGEKSMNILILCAGGDIENYEEVNKIYEGSLQCKFNNWIIRKFLPRCTDQDFTVPHGEIDFQPEDFKFYTRFIDGKLEMNFVLLQPAAQQINSSEELESLRMSLDIFLDTLVGEYINKKHIEYLNVFPIWSISRFPMMPYIVEWKPMKEISTHLKKILPDDPSCHQCGISHQHSKFITHDTKNYCLFCFETKAPME